jgi:hypothetical protein
MVVAVSFVLIAQTAFAQDGIVTIHGKRFVQIEGRLNILKADCDEGQKVPCCDLQAVVCHNQPQPPASYWSGPTIVSGPSTCHTVKGMATCEVDIH